MEKKYKPLQEFLSSISKNTISIHLSFSEIEAIIGSKLPPSAYKHIAWWANQKYSDHVQTRSWVDIGWMVKKPNLKSMSVIFVRGKNIRSSSY